MIDEDQHKEEHQGDSLEAEVEKASADTNSSEDIEEFKKKELNELNKTFNNIKAGLDMFKDNLKNLPAKAQVSNINHPQINAQLNEAFNSLLKINRDKSMLENNTDLFKQRKEFEEKQKEITKIMDEKYDSENNNDERPEYSPEDLLTEEGKKYLNTTRKYGEDYNILKNYMNSDNSEDNEKAKSMLDNSDPEFRDFVAKSNLQDLAEQENEIHQKMRTNQEVSEDELSDFKKQHKIFENYFPDVLEEQDRLKEEANAKEMQRRAEENEKRKNDLINKPIKENIAKTPDAGNEVILHFTDVHSNQKGLKAGFKRARELISEGKLNSIVLGGDMIRGGFNNKEDLTKFQSVSQKIAQFDALSGGIIDIVGALNFSDNDIKSHFSTQSEESRKDLKATLDEYRELHNLAKKNITYELTGIRDLAKKYGVDDYLTLVAGNYEGGDILEDVFDHDKSEGQKRVMGFRTKTDFRGYTSLSHSLDKIERDNAFNLSTVERKGVKFFGMGGAVEGPTEMWIPKELSEVSVDVGQNSVDQVIQMALSATLEPFIKVIGEKSEFWHLQIAQRRLTLADLPKIKKLLKGCSDKEVDMKKVNSLESSFKNNFTEFKNLLAGGFDYVKDKLKKSEADIFVSHHPFGSDMGYYESKAVNTGGAGSHDFIKYEHNDFKLGLYGHTHNRNVEAIKKADGSYFFSVSSRGLNYRDVNSDEKMGIGELKDDVRGEFAEIGIDENKDFKYVTFHQTTGDNLIKENSLTYTRQDVLENKLNTDEWSEERKKNDNRMVALDHVIYEKSSIFN